MANDNCKILCLDVSLSATGLAVISMTDDDKFILHSKNSIKINQQKNTTRFSRKYDIYTAFKLYFENFAKDVSFAVFENYAFGGVGQVFDIAEVSALYKLTLHEAGIPFDVIPPKSSKLIIAGSGNASKELVASSLKDFIINYDNFVFKSLDETDAIANGMAYCIKMMENLK